MPIVTSAILSLIVILVSGIAVGLIFNRFGRSWIGRKAAGATGMGDTTYALVGIAGAFIGFHIAVILGLLPTPLTLYIGAIIGSVLTVWLWRGR